MITADKREIGRRLKVLHHAGQCGFVGVAPVQDFIAKPLLDLLSAERRER